MKSHEKIATHPRLKEDWERVRRAVEGTDVWGGSGTRLRIGLRVQPRTKMRQGLLQVRTPRPA